MLNLGISFAVPYIAWQAHVGGLVAGALIAAAYVYAPRTNRAAIQVAATVGVLVLIAVGVLVRNHQLLGTFGFFRGQLF